ncbi:MAG: thiamine-phosphate kinase [Comamonas sp.]|nr:thiamine-phosphate kinase [Comamonas sp.]
MTQTRGEFALIRRFFQRPTKRSPLGVGDDCALLAPRPGMQLAVSSDMLLQDRHFFPDVAPQLLGHKALAVNLSDLAACGAKPLAFTLAIAMPKASAAWCQAFSKGLFALADAHDCELIGGDTIQGPLSICITVFGEVPQGQALLRSQAQVGDDIWVSGHLGDARLALEALLRQHVLPARVLSQARQRLEQPTPRVELGQALRGIANSAIDLSDGLMGDLGHILVASRVGACLELQVTRSLLKAAQHPQMRMLATSRVDICTLSGGDDYELCFTAAPSQRAAVLQAAQSCATPVSRIGQIEAEPGLRLRSPEGDLLQPPRWVSSFNHFS